MFYKMPKNKELIEFIYFMPFGNCYGQLFVQFVELGILITG